MSELKAHNINDLSLHDIVNCDFYLKPEADKVIAEKDKTIAELKDKAIQYKVLDKEHCRDLNTQERFFAKQIAHNKYKRCVAMARWCKIQDEFMQLESERLGLPQSTLFLEYRRKSMWWNKWRNRWHELAEKFKEAK
jgi:hypothetical protein